MITHTTDTPPSEADIFMEIFGLQDEDLNPTAARAILSIEVKKTTQTRVSRLLNKNSRETITAPEKVELNRYIKVAKFLDVLKAKAKLSLHRAGEQV